MNFKILALFTLCLTSSLNAEIVKMHNFVDAGVITRENLISNMEYIKMEGNRGLGGDLVGNGGGIAEKNILFSYLKLKDYMDLCINSSACKLNSWEKRLLKKISSSIGLEQRRKEQIQFVSEKNNPGFFMLDDELKIAKTGDELGSIIYINLDLLYTKMPEGYYKPFNIADSVALLVHELGHHHGVKDHSKLDLLGIKVSMGLENHSDKAALFPHSEEFMAISVNRRDAHKFPQVIIYFDDTILDISSEFKDALKCPRKHLYLGSRKPHGANFHNMFWKGLSRRFNTYRFVLSGNVSTYCMGEVYNPTQLRATTVDIKFKLKLLRNKHKKSGFKWYYLDDSLKVKHNKKKWWNAFRLPENEEDTPPFYLR